jgi:hypothetical protein
MLTVFQGMTRPPSMAHVHNEDVAIEVDPIKDTAAAIEVLLPFTKSHHKHVPSGDSGRREINGFLATLRAAGIAFTNDEMKPGTARTTRINVMPYEGEYLTRENARTHLKRVQKRRNELSPDDPITDADLEMDVNAAGKLSLASTYHFHRKDAANFYILFAHAPWVNFADADRMGWFIDAVDASDEQKREMWRNHEVPGHVVAVKVKQKTVGPPPSTTVRPLTACR